VSKQEAESNLTWAFNSAHPPSNVELTSYRTFGYFHDIQARWEREDWLNEEVLNKLIPFTIGKDVFLQATSTLQQHFN